MSTASDQRTDERSDTEKQRRKRRLLRALRYVASKVDFKITLVVTVTATVTTGTVLAVPRLVGHANPSPTSSAQSSPSTSATTASPSGQPSQGSIGGPVTGAGGGSGGGPSPAGGPGQPKLTAPTQVSPADGTVFTNYPRDTTLTWNAARGAASYLVEVECLDCVTVGQWSSWASATTKGTSYSFTWVGDNHGRWRVTATGADGATGSASGWWQFSHQT